MRTQSRSSGKKALDLALDKGYEDIVDFLKGCNNDIPADNTVRDDVEASGEAQQQPVQADQSHDAEPGEALAEVSSLIMAESALSNNMTERSETNFV